LPPDLFNRIDPEATLPITTGLANG